MPSIIQSALHPAGVQAARIEWLWWLSVWVSAGVFVLVLVALAAAVRRGRSADPARPAERTLTMGVSIATGLTLAILIALLTVTALTDRALASIDSREAVTITLTGYQWWWNVEYTHPEPSRRATAANEFHLPVGRPAVITLRAGDVIHSFWVPRLHGKIDLVPGRANTITLRADRPGVFRGQCGEYCGLQHAHMALVVVAEPPDQFERWLAAQRAPAVPAGPGTPEQTRGRELVERGRCALCHTVRGSSAGGRTAPDLTHFASRSTIGAGAAPNTRDHLVDWIADPQRLKPGNRMPPLGLSPDDVRAVVAYLETLR